MRFRHDIYQLSTLNYPLFQRFLLNRKFVRLLRNRETTLNITKNCLIFSVVSRFKNFRPFAIEPLTNVKSAMIDDFAVESEF